MRRLFRRRHRHKACSPQLNFPRASESSDVLPRVVGGSAIHNDNSIPFLSGMYARDLQANPVSPNDHISLPNRGEHDAVVELALSPAPANEQSEEPQVPLPSSTLEIQQATPTQVEPCVSAEKAENYTAPAPSLSAPPPSLTPKEQGSIIDTSADLGSSRRQKCEDCELECPVLWFCQACNLTFCDECWSKQLSHKKNKPGDVAHEKTDTEVAEKVKNVLTPPENEMACEKLHQDDELTAWFGKRLPPHFFCICTNAKTRVQ